MRLAVVLLRLMVPVPVMLRLPSIRRSVRFPTDCMLNTPLLARPPCRFRNALLAIFSVPALVTPAIAAVLPPLTTTCPPDAVENVPPVTRLPLLSTTLPPLMAFNTPLALWPKLVFVMLKLAPSARIRLLLVATPLVFSVMPLLRLAIQLPLLVTVVAPPAPIWPAPCTVTPLAKVSESAAVAA